MRTDGEFVRRRETKRKSALTLWVKRKRIDQLTDIIYLSLMCTRRVLGQFEEAISPLLRCRCRRSRSE